MSDMYDLYKPLRNYLRKANVRDSLGALRWYINYNQLSNAGPKPSDMEVHADFWQKHMIFTPPWQMALLVREMLIEGSLNGAHDMRQWRHLSSAVNRVKELEDQMSKRYLNQANVYHHLSKVMAHQQFVWQENRPNYQTSTRYYSIFQHPPLRAMFEKHFELGLEKYFLLSALTWGVYMTHISMDYPPTLQVKGVSDVDFDNFIKHYALTLEDLRARLADPSERRMDDSFLHYFDSLKKFPLILTDMYGNLGHACPVPTYLYWRTTDGIYYDLIDDYKNDKTKLAAFGEALGDAYSAYIGSVLKDQTYSRQLSIVDADSKIRFGDSKPDWFITDGDAVALIECKTKRLRLDAKTDTTYSPATESELTKLAKSVLQVYKALKFAKDQKLPYLGKNPQQYYPIVTTLENWYIFGDMRTQLDRLVIKLAPAEGVELSLIEEAPYSVISSDELEDLSAALRENPLSTIMGPYVSDPQYEAWSLKTYLWQQFPVTKSGYELLKSNPLDQALSDLTGVQITEGRIRGKSPSS